MSQMDQRELMLRAAQAARLRPQFLGNVFAKYETLEDLDETAMQRDLGISEADWLRLQLVRRPRASMFLKDVTAIASEFNLNRAALASVVRRADAAESLQDQRREPRREGRLLAARSRKKPKKSSNRTARKGNRHES